MVNSPSAPAPTAVTFGAIYGLESLARALVASIIPLSAYALLGSARDVSLLMVACSVTTLLLTLNLPSAIATFGRATTYRAGAVMFGLAPILVLLGALPLLAGGIVARATATAIAALVLNLYIQQFIQPQQWVKSEPFRLFCGGISWTIAPALGVWLSERFGVEAIAAAAILCAGTILAVFWRAGLGRAPEVALPASRGLIGNLGHFFRQRGLRLAFLLAVAKSAWWSVFYTYGPIMMVQGGATPVAASLLISIANAALFAAPLFGWCAHRFGLRRVLLASLAVNASATALATLAADTPVMAGAILVIGAIANTAVDGLNSVVLMRAVKPAERAAMGTVFMAHRESSELAAPAIMALVLQFFDLRWVFVVAAAWLALTFWLCRDLPPDED